MNSSSLGGQRRALALYLALLLLTQLATPGRGHAGCGHSRVAHQAKAWSQLHRQHRELLQRRQDAAQGLLLAPAATGANGSSTSSTSGDAAAAPALLRGGARGAAAERGRGAAARRVPPRRLAETPEKVPIRIWVEYQGLGALSADGKRHLQNTVNIALGVLQKFFKVRRPVPGRLGVKPFCRMWDSANYCNQHQPDFLGGGADNTCGSALINSSHIAKYTQCSLGGFSCDTYPGGGGEATDYYLYITAHQDEHCASGAVAWALPCLYDDATNRPLLGSANVCPEALLNADPDAGVAVLVHELTHALGFTDDMFDKFIDADGAPLPESAVVQEYVDAYGRTTPMIITPTVAAEVRSQFGCDRLPGAALENEGGQGSAMAHWEYRWFQGELMVATNLFAVYGKPATMSRITLAFMQDTGWYDVDWSAAGFLNWGYKAGCDFVAKTCADYIAAHPEQQYYCSPAEYADDVNTVCTFDGLARAKCEDAQFADGCIMKVALGTSPNCLSKQYASAAGDKFGWRNGLSSRCAPVTWLFNTHAYQFPDSSYKEGWRDSMCYASSCTDGSLQLDVLGTKVPCPSGQRVDLAKVLPSQFQKGLIGPCPDNAAYCGGLACGEACTVGGTCVAGRCYCNLAYTGPSCGQKLTADGNYSAYVPVVEDPTSPTPAAVDDGFLMVSARLSNDQEALYLALDKYKAAVAQLAGVATSRVAVLSFLTDAPATSLIGRRRAARRRLAAAGGGGDSDGDALWEPPLGGGAAGGVRGALRSLLQRSSGTLEVYSRVATISKSDADAITSRISNETRQAEFGAALAAAGLRLVAGSISVRSADAGAPGSGGWGLPRLSMSDPSTRRIIIIVAASVGAGLVLLLAAWAVSCCLRRRRRSRAAPAGAPSQQQFLTSPPGGGGGWAGSGSGSATPGSSGSGGGRPGGGGGGRTLFGARAAPAAPPPAPGGRPANPFAGSSGAFVSGLAGGGGRGGSAGYAPPPPAAGGVPAGGFTVAGQTFATRREAEEFALATALQRSLHESGPPQHFLPHASAGGAAPPPWRAAPEGPQPYPNIQYAPQPRR
ncbi:Invadolysin [Scenedesmus sp. PABB004]|nr:Invadolysin [Scenedesmus sp. PABB004]